MSVKTFKGEVAGKEINVEIGKLAGQANGSCVIKYGKTMVLVTATMSAHTKDADYFPLSVDYEEKYYAAGKIKGSKWIKRETRPSEEAILSGRLIDRSLRPRFNHLIRNEVQVVATILSFDGENDPDIPALFGASLALSISDIPFNGPVAGIRVGRVDGKLVFNPTYLERQSSDFDVVVAGTNNKINMIETGAKIIPEGDIVEAVEAGFKEFQKLIKFQQKIVEEMNPKKKELNVSSRDSGLANLVSAFVSPRLERILYTPNKHEYVEGLHMVQDELTEYIKEQFSSHPDLSMKIKEANLIFEEEISRIVHKNIIEHEKRPDGRKIDQLREINVEAGVLPYSHGTGLFNRGTTQALSILTLAAPGLEQWIETMEINLTKKRFMHHYIFPPFSVGEVGRLGFSGRREIGHGALAERALEPLIPTKDEFPYTIRVVSEILSSNGSSSMASVCGASLALMDGGVPIKDQAAGIAMGLMFSAGGGSAYGGEEKYKILTDIQGPEDHHGDMDLKVAGTKDGITAMQMDVKIEGIDKEILEKTLKQALKARLEILEVMNKTLNKPRESLSPQAPRVVSFKINPDKIRNVIGTGGKVINEIIDETGVSIDIDDDGTVFVTGDSENIEKAVNWIKALVYEAKVGDIFDGKVTRILDFGAFVEILPGQEGLVHVSEMNPPSHKASEGRRERVRHPSDVVKIGQSVKVKIKNVDDYGRINLTMKDVS